jgi:hypothetical protein
MAGGAGHCSSLNNRGDSLYTNSAGVTLGLKPGLHRKFTPCSLIQKDCHLMGLSHEKDFKKVEKNLQN